MIRRKPQAASRRFERELALSKDKQQYVLRLYITGATARSAHAILNIKSICEEHLHGRYVLEVIDIHDQPELAKSDQIVAAPTLIKQLPAPLRRFIGDMSRTERILLGMELRPKNCEATNEAESDSSNGAKPRF